MGRPRVRGGIGDRQEQYNVESGRCCAAGAPLLRGRSTLAPLYST